MIEPIISHGLPGSDDYFPALNKIRFISTRISFISTQHLLSITLLIIDPVKTCHIACFDWLMSFICILLRNRFSSLSWLYVYTYMREYIKF